VLQGIMVSSTKVGRFASAVVAAFAFGYCLCLIQYGNVGTLPLTTSATSTSTKRGLDTHVDDGHLSLRQPSNTLYALAEETDLVSENSQDTKDRSAYALETDADNDDTPAIWRDDEADDDDLDDDDDDDLDDYDIDDEVGDEFDDELTLLARNESPLRFCDVRERIQSPLSEAYIPIRYRCEGPLYDQFAEDLHAFIDQYDALDPLWGRQGLAANSSTLIVGNSHLQQITETLVCQEDRYGSRLVEITYLDPEIYESVARRYTFRNGAVIYHTTNTYAVHMKDWTTSLANQLGRRLDSFDKVIFGAANSCTPPVKTNFATEMNDFLTTKFGRVCDRPEGPFVADFVSVFPHQPLLYVSMFATYQSKVYRDAHRKVHALQRDKAVDIAYLEARKYVKAMGLPSDTGECGSPRASVISDCIHGEKARRRLHRCTGTKGSHPDLIAWDLVDFVNSL
jgi:hypothetical protein